MTFASWLRGAEHTRMIPRRTTSHARRSTARLAVRGLEDRTVPSAAVDFAAAQTYPSGGTGAYSVATADFNSDGHADLAVVNDGNDRVAVLLGNGSGGFASPVAVTSGGSGPHSVAVGDFNNDGKADLAVAHRFSDTVGVLLGTGTGGFAPAGTVASGGSSPRSVAVGDFNADGRPDLAVANMFSDTVGVLLGTGTGGFAPAATFGTGGPRPISVAVGDFNNDGHADLAAANLNNATVGVLLGAGTGGFAPASTFASGGTSPDFVAVGDFNTDGRADLVVANGNGGNVGVLLASPAGGFAPVATFAASQPSAIAVGDFNNDGHADFAAVNQLIGVSVRSGDGLGGFGAAATFGIGSSRPFSVVGADFDNDGRTDLAATDWITGTVGVLMNATILNRPPVNAVPGDQVAAEDVARVIGGLAVADDDPAGVVTVALAVAHGTLIVDWGVAGANGTVLSGNGTSTVILTGTQAQVNATLAAGLLYRGVLDYSGLDTLTMTATDAGGLTDTDAVAIQVLSAQQQAEVVAAIIADLGDDGTLSGGQENALVKKLGFLAGPNAATAVQAFINQVNGMVYAGILTQDQGNTLIDAAATIVAGLQ